MAIELRRWRSRAARIPDPALRELALQALELKRANVEGAAAFSVLAAGANRPTVTKALVGCQIICDYVDLVAEQPSEDPVENGYRLHEALMVATGDGASHRDYYAEHSHGEDGGYLCALVDSVREALASLPSVGVIADVLARASERIAVYQSFNHGDADGSFGAFEAWAARGALAHQGLRPWEAAAGAGSTLVVLAMIAAAADPALQASAAQDMEDAYFPWIGALHSLLDSLVDYHEDLALEGRSLVDYYGSEREAAQRMRLLAGESLRRAHRLPGGRRHVLIVVAMASLYICELDRRHCTHARPIAAAVLDVCGGLARPNMAMLEARRSLRRRSLTATKAQRLLSVAGTR